MPSLHRLLHTLPSNRIIAVTICFSTYRRCDCTGHSSRRAEHRVQGYDAREREACIARALCPFYHRSHLSPHRGSSPKGRRTFNITPSHLSSRFLLRLALSEASSSRWLRNDHRQHAGVSIVASCTRADLIDDIPVYSRASFTQIHLS